jgi:RNA polymerase sigma factor (sigma-70 family)
MPNDLVGSWLDAAGRFPLLTELETLELAAKIQAETEGTPARTRLVNKLCEHNLRLVVRFTKAYINASPALRWGDDKTADLLQEAYFGLRKAANKFDPTRGYKFSTYAHAWIRQAASRKHVDQISLIRVPESSARELFYFIKNGKPRNDSQGKWVERGVVSMNRAYALGSLDAEMETQVSLLDSMSDENRIIQPSDEGVGVYDKNISRVDYHGIMSKAGIEPRVQDLLMAYARRGNLESACRKVKFPSTHSRAVINDAIDRIKAVLV